LATSDWLRNFVNDVIAVNEIAPIRFRDGLKEGGFVFRVQREGFSI